jgi:beta-glucosidase
MPWLNLVPDSVYWACRHVHETLGFRGETFITENGCAAQDHRDENGEIKDLDRILYLREHLRQIHRATAEGYPMTGYMLWSFMDNFEWSWGYSKRFGIVWNDYETQTRVPKLSAQWYSEVIRQNRVV